MKGTIFNIDEFAVHDGPGIRKLVFFKGCPLHCIWCHNPEGISFSKELMIVRANCDNCGKCVEICNHNKCIACGECVKVCHLGLRRMCGQEIEAYELAKTLRKDEDILEKSRGGITISGGEPLAQPDFLFALISCLKPLNIAVETSGYAPDEIFRKMVHEVDYVYMDIKHTDPVIHKKYTGVNNVQILENLKYVCSSETHLIIRIPLIPGVNDTKANIEETVMLIKNAKNLKKVELLPYNRTAPAKYAMLNKKYNPGFDTNKDVNARQDVFKQNNINFTIL